MNSSLPHRFPGILLLLLLGCVSAQPPQGAPEEEVPPLRFRIMGMDSVVSGLSFVNEDGVQSFIASHSRPTEWMEYRGASPLRFFRTSDLEALTEESPPPPVMASFFPPPGGDWLLLFVRDPGAGDLPRFRVVPIPDVPGDIQEGLRFYNLTRQELAVRVNQELVRIQPGQQQQINPPPGPDSGMDLEIVALREGGWDNVSSTVFGHRPSARITFYLVEVGGRFQFKRFLERTNGSP